MVDHSHYTQHKLSNVVYIYGRNRFCFPSIIYDTHHTINIYNQVLKGLISYLTETFIIDECFFLLLMIKNGHFFIT